jgi:hypothetical protein
MKTAEPSSATPASSPPSESFSRTNSPKVLPSHLEKLAIVYVRQSHLRRDREHHSTPRRLRPTVAMSAASSPSRSEVRL